MPEAPPIALRCDGLSKAFGDAAAVDDASFHVTAGTVLALLGPSGCGKTTTLRLIAGLDRPDAGTIVLGGSEVQGPDVSVPPERRRVGLVFQDYALFPHLDVRANVGFGLSRRNGRAARVAETLELVGLSALASRMPHELSGGQQQRVALARALAPNPRVVLLDEPFSNLDAALRNDLRNDVRRVLRESGTTAVFVTHDQEEALSLADQVAVMIDGRVLQVGAAARDLSPARQPRRGRLRGSIQRDRGRGHWPRGGVRPGHGDDFGAHDRYGRSLRAARGAADLRGSQRPGGD